MKKVLVTVLLTCLMTATFAQQRGGGMFEKGETPETQSEESSTPMIPRLGQNRDQTAPLGSGLLLIGFGAAYALLRKDKKEGKA